MINITAPNIVQHGSEWQVSGDLLMDNANEILLKSESLSMNGGFVVDFSAVTKIDTAALSLMMEWQRRAFASRSKVSFANLPTNLSHLVTLYGVEEFVPLSTS
jgi:phospholipid transport system transporter-binding protein